MLNKPAEIAFFEYLSVIIQVIVYYFHISLGHFMYNNQVE